MSSFPCGSNDEVNENYPGNSPIPGREERERLKNELNAFQNRFSLLARFTRDIFYVLDQEGNIALISDPIKSYGYDPRELVGTPILQLVHPKDRKNAHWHVMERRTGGRRTSNFMVRLLPKNIDINEEYGEEPVISLTAEGCYRAAGDNTPTFIGTVGVAREVNVESETMVSLYHSIKDLEKKLGAAFPNMKPSVTFELPSEHNEEPDEIKLTLSVIKDLARIIPICSHCRRVRNNHKIWEEIEQYIMGTLGSHFTHSICPECEKKYYEDIGI